MKYLPVLLLIALIIFSITNKGKSTQPLTQNDSILAFGDSLTYGYNAQPTESYPEILSHLSGLNVINAGISGESSAEGLQRLPKLLEKKNVKRMILFLGANDILQRLSMKKLKKNLKTMIQMAKTKHIKVLLISSPNLSLFGLSPLELYEEVAKEEDVPLLSRMMVDILENPSLKSDQVHPNAKGYKIMGEKIYEKLRDIGWIEE